MRRLLPVALVALAALLAGSALGVPAHAVAPRTADPAGPAGTARAAARPVHVPAAKGTPRALFFGDSYFVGGGCSPDAKQDMAYLAGTQLGYRTTVRGAGGTGFVAANPEYDLPPYLAQVQQGALDLRSPRLVVIAGGSNDIGQPLDQVAGNAKKILKIARQKYPHALVVLVGPLDPYGGYDDSAPIRDALRAVAKRLDVPFVDDMTWLAGHPDWLCDDYVHPTYAAQVSLAQRLAKALVKRGAH